MKLYTEEQVNKIAMQVNHLGYYDNSITPIELPSDEDAAVIAVKISNNFEYKMKAQEEVFFVAGFQSCNKWMKEQLTNKIK